MQLSKLTRHRLPQVQQPQQGQLQHQLAVQQQQQQLEPQMLQQPAQLSDRCCWPSLQLLQCPALPHHHQSAGHCCQLVLLQEQTP
jgi:hypothetical protein